MVSSAKLHTEHVETWPLKELPYENIEVHVCTIMLCGAFGKHSQESGVGAAILIADIVHAKALYVP